MLTDVVSNENAFQLSEPFKRMKFIILLYCSDYLKNIDNI